MIIVNVNVPALEKVYNFSVEEKAKVGDLIEELVELIIQKECVPFGGDIRKMVLCSVDCGAMCDKEKCLNDYGVCGGGELVLV